MWIYATLASAIFLGLYDVTRKRVVMDNAVLPTLACTSGSSAILAGQAIIVSRLSPEFARDIGIFVPELSWHAHGLLAIKGLLVASSWVFAFFAVKHLPITIVAPIRASAPLWTLIGVVVIFGERFTPMQWCGLAVVLGSYYSFSLHGKAEGIVFHRNKWIYCIFAATLLGAASAMYDKYLMQNAQNMGEPLLPVAVLAWFLFYLSIMITTCVFLFWYPRREKYTRFKFHWAMPLVGAFLVIADTLYFTALHNPAALLGIVSAIRRTSVVVSFMVGAFMFSEVNWRRKLISLFGVLAGVFLIIFAT